MVVAIGLVTAVALPATAQNWGAQQTRWGWQDRDHDRDRNRDTWNHGDRTADLAARNGREDGLKDGRWVRERGYKYDPHATDHYKSPRGYNPRFGDLGAYALAYRQAYDQGYADGYNGRGYRGNYGAEAAARNGREDGLKDGRWVRERGYKYDPHATDHYKSPRGYNPRFGDLSAYALEYRQAYDQGYAEGYNQPGRRR